MENQSADSISRILAIVMEILEEIRSLKEHRSVLEGDPMLEFSEVCQMLRQSERQVRRYREQGRLVGFTFGLAGCTCSPRSKSSSARCVSRENSKH